MRIARPDRIGLASWCRDRPRAGATRRSATAYRPTTAGYRARTAHLDSPVVPSNGTREVPVSHRVAALAVALLAPIGIGFAAPVVLHGGGVQSAQAGEAAPPVAAPDPAASPSPAPPAPVATPVPAPTVAPPVLRPLPPKPKDTLRDEQLPGRPTADTGGRTSGDETQKQAGTGAPSSPAAVQPPPVAVAAPPVAQGSPVASSTTQSSTLGDAGTVPQGGVQAGGGGTLPTDGARPARPSRQAVAADRRRRRPARRRLPMLTRVLAVVWLALAVLVAYGLRSSPQPRFPSPAARSVPQPAPPIDRRPGGHERGLRVDRHAARPRWIRIPAIGVSARVVALGLGRDGALRPPRRWGQTGWYEPRPEPGERGAAVVVGHVDSYTGPAVFFRLRTLAAGDVIHIRRSDHSIVRFRVRRVEQWPKAAFPTRRVYGPARVPALRLVTCSGTFDASSDRVRAARGEPRPRPGRGCARPYRPR